jgi:hypothetical protein
MMDYPAMLVGLVMVAVMVPVQEQVLAVLVQQY